MIKQLVVHVGDSKTGSTSIQATLANNGWTTPTDKAICYPAVLNHINLALSIGKPKQAKMHERGFNRLRKRFLESDADMGVISAEILEFIAPQDLLKVLQRFLPEFTDNMRVLAYVRPHGDRLVSGFSERIKQGFDLASLDAMADFCAKSKLLNFADRMDAWRAVFGDRYEVRPMVRSALRNSDVVEDFLGWIFGDVPITVTQKSANESLCLEDLIYMRELQSQMRALGFAKKGNPRGLGIQLGPIVAANHQGRSTKLQLHRALANRIRTEYARDAERVDRDHIGAGTILSDALSEASNKALAEPMSLLAGDYLTPMQIGHLRAQAQLLMRIYQNSAGPKVFNDLVTDPAQHNRRKKI